MHMVANNNNNSIPTAIAQPRSLVAKRQHESVVHVTITAAGTVVYTQTATSYSYIPTYSPVFESPSANGNNGQGLPNGGTGSNTSSEGGKTNIGAIVGGVVGGVAFVALIGLGFLLMRRKSQRKKREKEDNEFIDEDDSYYQTNNHHSRHHSSTTNGIMTTTPDGLLTTTATGSPLAPRHLVAPLEGDGRESKFYSTTGTEGGSYYYEDIVIPSYSAKPPYYSANNSIVSDSLPSTAIDSNNNLAAAAAAGYTSTGVRHVPNEVDYPIITNSEERHVPHLKDDDITRIEPPHTRD
ncbi:MAG: hypothetical protein EXX96DRAFT_566147 [Benjaminiella poitrasii]|nr:MAG: hypothetical protein EXX96DRAFT_566147 [Benjaminiella poitrasii]